MCLFSSCSDRIHPDSESESEWRLWMRALFQRRNQRDHVCVSCVCEPCVWAVCEPCVSCVWAVCVSCVWAVSSISQGEKVSGVSVLSVLLMFQLFQVYSGKNKSWWDYLNLWVKTRLPLSRRHRLRLRLLNMHQEQQQQWRLYDVFSMRG